MSDQTIEGNNRSNIIISGADDDTINAGGGHDLIISGAGDDTINGGSGNDIIISGSGDDVINGGSGADIIISGSGDDTVNGGSGDDIIISGSGDDTVDGGSGNDIILSGSGDDVVSGGAGNDYIDSGSGNDIVSGGSGNDTILTGTGDDSVTGDNGNDTIISGAGHDTVLGNSGHDIIITGTGNDYIDGGDGNDIIVSGEGDDTVNGGNGHDVILSGDGADTINAGNGHDVVLSGLGDDVIDGGDGDDWIHAGADNDIIYGGAGNDYINGGSEYDIAVFDGNYQDYTITSIDAHSYSVTHNVSGEVDTVVNVELLRFSDIDFDPSNPSPNNNPTAVNDTASVNEDASVVIDVLANDSDLDGDSLTISSASAANGSVIINTDGTVTYTPNADFNGQDTISYEISDGQGGTATAQVAVTVNAVNDGPVAQDDAVSVNEDASVIVNVLANDSDLDGDSLTVTTATATNGSVVINTDGTVTYTPNADFNGQDTISYEISDGQGGTATAQVAVTVNAVNDGPVAQDDAVSVNEDASVVIDVLANDSDLDGDSLTISSASAANGSVIINTDGTVTYTPNADFNGQDTISYEISDGQGGTATAQVAVTVNAVNDGPVAQDDAVSVNEDASVIVNVLANDSDLDGDTLTISSASAANGSVVINTDGTVTYTPNADFNGQDTISYEISDGQGGTATAQVAVTVNAVNDGPVAQDDAVSVNEDASVIVNVLANDSDLDGDSLTVSSASAANGSVVINIDGTVTYTPNADFNGQDTISYEISDGQGGTATAQVAVTVNAVNDGPVAQDDAVSVNEDASVVIDVLANDSDLDGDSLTVSSASAANGSVVINTDGTVTYTPNADFNGQDTISYEISDGQGGTATAQVAVTVNAVNDGPVAQDDAVSVNEDASVIVNVLANDSDLDGDSLTVSSASAANGSVVINIDGTVTYTPNADFNGQDTISYEISDGQGGTATAQVAVTVNAVNDGPVAQDDAVSVNEDASVVIDVLANDSDLDGDSLTVSSASAANGSVVINTDGTVTYTPNADFNGQDTISYEISDGQGGTATAQVAVTVNAVNDGPVAQDDSVSVNEDASVTVNVLANDSDLDGDSLTVSSASAANGSVVINTDGTVTYTPNADFNGQDTISYEISDGQGGTATAQVAVTVNAVNDGPVAQDDAVSVNEDASVIVNVLANDSDLDGDSLTVTTATATNGSVVINTDGTVTYTPNADFNGQDTISYEISDGQGGTATAQVSVTVNAVNDGPVAQDDSATVDEDGSVTVDVLANDSDLDGDTLTVSSASAANGSVIINTDGTVTYTPNADFNGQDTISYEISDGQGGTATAQVAVTVNAVNDGPVAQDDAVSVNEDASVVIDVLANDSDLDGDSLTVSSASAANGSVVINTDGTVTYTPNADFNGQDTILYEISDGQGGTATAQVAVTVNAVNVAPVAQNDSATVEEDGSVVIDVLANDSDIDGDSLTVTTATATNGSVVINTDGTVTYTPNSDFNGQDTISYEISDGQGGTSNAEVAVTVNAQNNNPVAQDDAVSVNKNASAIIDVLANDSDLDGDSLTVTTATATNGSVVINADGTVTYTPNSDYSGQDTISYEISDGQGGTATAQVAVTVSTNTAPVAVDDEAIVQAGTYSAIANIILIPGGGIDNNRLTADDTDADGDTLTIIEIDGQSLNGSALTVPGSNGGFFKVYPTGHAEFDATTGFENILPGNVETSSITYTISDGNGGTATATVTVTIRGTNDAPVAIDDSASVNEDESVIIDVLANDTDANGNALTVVSASAQNGTVVVNVDGTLTYTPNADFNGQDTLNYTISDGLDETSATVGITVSPQNDAPVSEDDVASVQAGTNTVIDNILSNDSDIDGGALTIIEVDGQVLNGSGITVPGSNGGFFTVYPNGQAEFDASAGFENILPGANETSSITYTVSDGNGGIATSTVTVTIRAANDAPVAADDNASVNEDQSVIIDVLANDSDLDGDTLTVTSASALNGAVVINPDGTITYTPDADFNGQDIISYEISDGEGGSSVAEVTVTVNAMNDAPDAQDDSVFVGKNASAVIDVLVNDSDLEGDSLTVTSASAANGSVVINADGTVTYTPNADYSGQDTISYEISDGQGGTATAQVAVTVSTNTAPVAVDDEAIVQAGTYSAIANIILIPGGGIDNNRLTADDTDADGDTLTIIEIDGQSLNGSALTVPGSNGGFFKVYPTGHAEFDATTGFESVAEGDSVTSSIIYTISDGRGGLASASVTVTINGVNDNPNAVDDAISTSESDSVIIDMLANDSDVDGDVLSVSSVDTTNLTGLLVDNGDGTFTYDANQQFDYLNDGETATDFFEYTIDDGLGGLDTAQVMITIQGSTVNATASSSAGSSTETSAEDAPADGSNDYMV